VQIVNILFVHEVDWLKKVVFEIHNLAESLSVLGHRVFAIDYEDTWRRSQILDLGSCKTREFKSISRAVPGSSVDLRRPGFIKIPVFSRLSAGLTHYLEIQKTLREKHIDVIVLYSVPTNGLQAIHLAKKSGIPVVFRSIDILHGQVRPAVLRPATRFLEKKVYARADKILAITPNHFRYVVGMGTDESKVKLLLLPIDTGIFNPSIESLELRQKWMFDEKNQIIVFIGTLFEFSGLDGFIRQFPQVIDAIPEARLLVVGDGPQHPKLERIINKTGLNGKVIITGFQPYSTIPQYISMAKVCINPFLNTDATRDIFPGKIIQYLACGKAAVATPLLGITTLIKGESQGIIYADSAEDMAEEVIALLKSPERRQRMESAGLSYVKQSHDQEKITRQLEAELLTAVENKSRGKMKG
jgi:glycosyltransferase involved in cell wall biosynthesis